MQPNLPPKISDEYRKLIDACHRSRSKYSESYLCAFSMGIGKKFSGKLLVVGRATNGWKNGFSKEDAEDCRRLSDSLQTSIATENLDWVTQHWGATDKYNTRKSAFWRLAKMLARRIASDSEDCIDHICWSNLYKIAPDGGNPSIRLMNAQFERCADVLRAEIATTQAENVIFLTGYHWARPFLEKLDISNPLPSKASKFVEFAASIRGVRYIVGQHPQGKPEASHCEEIIQVLDRLKADAHAGA